MKQKIPWVSVDCFKFHHPCNWTKLFFALFIKSSSILMSKLLLLISWFKFKFCRNISFYLSIVSTKIIFLLWWIYRKVEIFGRNSTFTTFFNVYIHNHLSLVPVNQIRAINSIYKSVLPIRSIYGCI